jgi:hypothetical protein
MRYSAAEVVMSRLIAALAIAALVGGGAAAQEKKKEDAGSKAVLHDITVTADVVYTGTMSMAIEKGKVTGDLRITVPTEVTGKVAGTAKGNQLALEFPFYMTEQQCEGFVKMDVALPEKAGAAATGKLTAVGCGIEESQPLVGAVELKPSAAKGEKK